VGGLQATRMDFPAGGPTRLPVVPRGMPCSCFAAVMGRNTASIYWAALERAWPRIGTPCRLPRTGMNSAMSNRRPYVGGNWKMNGRINDVADLARAVVAGLSGDVDVAVFPAFPHLITVAAVLQGSPVKLGGQDLFPASDGAYTGEVSTGMLKEIGVEVVLVGHSERRHVIGESAELINQKARAVLAAGMELLFCIGETEEERRDGRTDEVNRDQLLEGLAGVNPDDLERLTVAYEPVWAIGTGMTASTADAQNAHDHIRRVLEGFFEPVDAGGVRILYGGSVKPENAAELFAGAAVDGGLVGGASLDSHAFNMIVGHAAGA